ncbi:MAG: RING finger domain protein, partial [Homavirus sp.]
QYFLWYRYDEVYDDFTIDDDINKKRIDKNLDFVGFPEYKPIAYAIVNFVEENTMIADNSDTDSDSDSDSDGHSDSHSHSDTCTDSDVEKLYIMNVMVDERSKYAKGHPSLDDTGFVRIFSLIFDSDYVVSRISINVKMVSEPITLTSGKKSYPVVPVIDDNEDNEANINNTDNTDNTNNTNNEDNTDMDCSICLSSKGTLIETPCKHSFHLECLRCVPKLRCPLCRESVTDFLEMNGITKEEIETRLKDEKNEAELEDLCTALDDDFVNNLNEIDFIRTCMYTLKLNNGDTIAYQDLIFDMNANGSELFSEISFINSKKEKGLFVYVYDSPVDLICQMLDIKSPSFVEWVPIGDLEDTPLEAIANDRVNRINNSKDQYVVMIVMDNLVNAHIVDRAANQNPLAHRIHQNDILNSLLKCIRYRSTNANNSPNREYIWARNTLKELKRKIKKQQNKKQYKKQNKKTNEKSTKETDENPIKKTDDKSTEKPDENPIEKSTDKSTEKPDDKSTKETDEKSTEEINEKPTKKPVKKPTKKPVKKPANKTAKKPANKTAKKTAKKTDNKTDNKTG